MLANVPEEHKQFLRELSYIHEIPGFIFVHGGLMSKPGLSSEAQLEEMRDTRRFEMASQPKQLFLHTEVVDAPNGLMRSISSLCSAISCFISCRHSGHRHSGGLGP